MPEYTAANAHAAVARGAAWLDAKCPTWINEIDLDKLNLINTELCVLGQTADCLVGPMPNGVISIGEHGYWRVLMAQAGPPEMRERWAAFNGFKVGSFDGDVLMRYEMLTIAWKEFIRQRLDHA